MPADYVSRRVPSYSDLRASDALFATANTIVALIGESDEAQPARDDLAVKRTHQATDTASTVAGLEL